MKECAQMALDVQNASNLSGVVRSFSEALQFLHRSPECKGTNWIRTHPVSQLFSDKIADLTGVHAQSYWASYKKCEQLAERETV